MTVTVARVERRTKPGMVPSLVNPGGGHRRRGGGVAVLSGDEFYGDDVTSGFDVAQDERELGQFDLDARLKHYRAAARGYLQGPEEWREKAICLAAELDCGLMHAGNLVQAERDAARERCSLCGEPSRQLPAHELCKARERRGLPTPPVPYNHPCGCARCNGRPIEEAVA